MSRSEDGVHVVPMPIQNSWMEIFWRLQMDHTVPISDRSHPRTWLQTYLVSVSEPRSMALLSSVQDNPLVARSAISFVSLVIGQCTGSSWPRKWGAHDCNTVAEVLMIWWSCQLSIIRSRRYFHTPVGTAL